MSIATQNWDAPTPPANPRGMDCPIARSSHRRILVASPASPPPPSPNMLASLASGTNSHYFATYGTTDGNSGNVVVSANFNTPSVTNSHTWGLTVRGSASGLNVTSTTFYWLQFSAYRGEMLIYKMVSGTQTSLATLSSDHDQRPCLVHALSHVHGLDDLRLGVQRQATATGSRRPDRGWRASRPPFRSPIPR